MWQIYQELTKDMKESMKNKDNIGVVGLGYVGLPLAVAFSKKFNVIVEFNSNENKNHNKDFEKFRVIKFEKNYIQSQIWPLRTRIVTQQVENSYLYKFDISLPLNNWSIFLNAAKIFHKNNNKIKFDSSNRVDFVVINNMVKKKSNNLTKRSFV